MSATSPCGVEDGGEPEAWASFLRCMLAALSGETVARPCAKVIEGAAAALSASICLRDVAGDADALIVRLALADGFLAAARDGAWGIEARMAAQPDAPGWYGDPSVSARVQDALTAAATGGKRSLSPFTGAILSLAHNIGPDAFLLRDAGRCCVVLQWSEISVTHQDTAWYFPEEGLLLYRSQSALSEEWYRRYLREFLLQLGHHFPQVSDYLRQPTREVMLVEPECPHIGHYIWNAISGWDGVFRWIEPERIGALATCGPLRILGGVQELYADRVHPETAVVEYAENAGLWEAILRRRALAITVRDRRIAADLAHRVLEWCAARVGSEFHAKLHAARSASRPLMLITLRLENRSWAEQEEGFVALVHALRAEHPDLGVAIDGMNGEFNTGWSHAEMSLEAEKALAARIVARLGPDVPVFDSIGCRIAESLLLAQACDFFVAPIGAGMAKSRWIANLSGVAFSNTAWLDPAESNGRLYDHYREEARAAVYLKPGDVVDLPEERGLGRRNFSLDWQRLHAATRDFLATFRWARHLS